MKPPFAKRLRTWRERNHVTDQLRGCDAKYISAVEGQVDARKRAQAHTDEKFKALEISFNELQGKYAATSKRNYSLQEQLKVQKGLLQGDHDGQLSANTRWANRKYTRRELHQRTRGC